MVLGELAIAFLIFGVIGVIAGFSSYKKKMIIENTPTSKVRSIAMGLVEIFGKVIPASAKSTLISPLTRLECVYYKYIIEEYRKTGKHSQWVTIKTETISNPFYIQDSTGSVLVDSTGANVSVPQSFACESGLFQELPENAKTFMERINLKHEGIFGINRKLRFSEYIIKPNMELYVLGTAGDNPHKDEATAMHSMEDIMIQKGKGRIFLISNSKEKDLIKTSSIVASFGLIGGPILITLGVLLMML